MRKSKKSPQEATRSVRVAPLLTTPKLYNRVPEEARIPQRQYQRYIVAINQLHTSATMQ